MDGKVVLVHPSQPTENGLKIARFLKQHKKVNKVTYPGLPNHPQKEIARKKESQKEANKFFK